MSSLHTVWLCNGHRREKLIAQRRGEYAPPGTTPPSRRLQWAVGWGGVGCGPTRPVAHGLPALTFEARREQRPTCSLTDVTCGMWDDATGGYVLSSTSGR
jgi:hypothetical protein